MPTVTRYEHEAPHPTWPEPTWRSPRDPEDQPEYEPAAFDPPPLRSPADVPEALRGWVCDAIDTACQVLSPGGAACGDPQERALDAILCDLRAVAEDAAAVLEGRSPRPWQPASEDARETLRDAGRAMLRGMQVPADDTGAALLAFRSLGLAEEAPERAAPEVAPRTEDERRDRAKRLAARHIIRTAEAAGDDVLGLLADLSPEELARRIRGERSGGEDAS